jgi:hypothetical protein
MIRHTKHFDSIFILCLLLASTIMGQYAKRQDAIWARNIGNATITLDGHFNEPEWAKAESLVIRYGYDSGLPTSGWREEFQPDAITDPTNAVVKFLVKGNKLYLGFIIPDSSVGGKRDWARWDGILMSVKDISSPNRPAPAAEYFYTWWLEGLADTASPWVGRPPRFIGKFGDWTGVGRTPDQIEAWNAVTFIDGLSNDGLKDKGWYTEMVVDLAVLGYDATKAEGDVVELNFSIWDCDYLFAGDPMKISTTRTHWQSPWGNTNANNVGRIYCRPDVTVNTTTLPDILPDVIIPNGANFAAPTIDGQLNEEVWKGAKTFEIAWNDQNIRNSYPGIGPFMSGQFQPELVQGSRPPVLDSAYAKVKFFFKDKYLYVAADVNDQIVQGTEVYDKVDGFGLILGDRVAKNVENSMIFKLLRANFSMDGSFAAYDALPALLDSSDSQIAHSLKGATTVNVNSDVDEGYIVEMKIDLTKLGYPADLGDKLMFMGFVLFDGDSFDDQLNNYGTRVWFFREHAGGPATTWAVLDPNTLVGVEENTVKLLPSSVELLGNYPNPFNPSTTIKFSVPETGNANIVFYNSLGQLVKAVELNSISAGNNEFKFNAAGLSSGVYFYQIKFNGTKQYTSNVGKILLMK